MTDLGGRISGEDAAAALARLYDLDLAEDPGDVDLYLALARRAAGAVVELATGSGRISVPLAAAGHAVVGIDLDPAMLERARTRAEALDSEAAGRLELVVGDVLEPRAELAGRFGLSILALNSILLFDTPERQARVVDVLAGLLAPGGIAVIDAWQPRPRDLVGFDGRISLEWLREDPESGDQVVKTAAAWYEPETRTVTLTTIFDASQPGGATRRWTRTDRLRLPAPDEVLAWVEAAGLEVEELGGDYDMRPFGRGSERLIVVARRP
ncbi:MAG TPA: class I SAM-dependent methyltransferase [Candidatus Limnocylindrales bacterium]|nr:class I SAM-dependent methyltransferase [Candidatus Limnocylindrales bacterium]